MKPTEQQLQIALTRALPEQLGVKGSTICWNNEFVWGGAAVTEHEWPAIVGMVEESLTQIEWMHYLRHLAMLVREPKQSEIQIQQYMLASWQVRAQALTDLGAITIEEQP